MTGKACALCNLETVTVQKERDTDTDPNNGKNRRSPIFRFSGEFRYSNCS